MHQKGYIKYSWLIEIKLILIADSKKYNIFFFIYLSQYQSFPIEYACECKPNKTYIYDVQMQAKAPFLAWSNSRHLHIRKRPETIFLNIFNVIQNGRKHDC